MPNARTTISGSTTAETFSVGGVQISVSEYPMTAVSGIDGGDRFPGGHRSSGYTFHKATVISGGHRSIAYGQSQPEAVFEVLHQLAIEINGEASDLVQATRIAEAVRGVLERQDAGGLARAEFLASEGVADEADLAEVSA
jgi:hypothetical protein